MNLDLTKKINDFITKEYSSNTLKVEEDYKEISSGIQQILCDYYRCRNYSI